METEKLKQSPRPGWLSRTGWMHHRYFAYYMGLMYFIGGVIHLLDTDIVNWLFKVKGMSFAAIFMGAPASLPAGIAYFAIQPPFDQSVNLLPSTQTLVNQSLIMLFMSVLFVLILRCLQQFRRVFKILVYLNFLPHVILLVLLVLARIQQPGPSPDIASTTTETTCDFTVTDSVQIRAITYFWHQPSLFEDGWSQSFAHTRFSVSTDSGTTRHEFMILLDQPRQCQALQNLKTGYMDDAFFWLWTDSWVVVTHDGGVNWQLELMYKLPVHGKITDVSFDTLQTGQITVETFEYDSRNQRIPVENTLTTNDGGMTWQVK